MPTLTIEGRDVEVDDSFLTLSPEAQNATVDEIAVSLGIQAGSGASGDADPAPALGIPADDPRMEYIRRAKDNVAAGAPRGELGPNHSDVGERFGGVALNTTAGANEGLYGLPGVPVDLAAGAMNIGIRGFNAATGSDVGTIDDPFLGSGQFKRAIGGALGELDPVLDPRNTRASTAGERIARTAGEAAGSSIAGAGIIGGLGRVGALSDGAATTAANLLGRSSSAGVVAGEAAISGAAGAGSGAAMEAVPDQWKPLAGLAGGLAGGGGAATAALGLPAAVRAGGRVIGDQTAIYREAGRERLAAERLRASTRDPMALQDQLARPAPDLVPGSKPTTGQLTGDMGILNLEREVSTRNPVPFLDRRAEQNTARRGALSGIQADGAPEAVAATVKDRLAQIEADEDARLDQIMTAANRRTDMARDGARANTDRVQRLAGEAEAAWRARVGRSDAALGAGMTPEDAGASLRQSLDEAKAAREAQEAEIWKAVDPEKKLVVPATNLRTSYADQVQSRTISERQPEGEEAAIHAIVEQYGDAMPFREVTKLRSRISQEMRLARREGNDAAYGRLTQLRGAIERDLSGVYEKQALADDEAVRVGAMRPEDTLSARIAANAPSVGDAVFTPGGRRVGVQYEVVEGDSLVASNLDDGRVNPAYPAGLQPRDRTRAVSNAQVAGISRYLQPERLGPSSSAAEGAPIIGPDGTIESGNGRTLGIRRAYAEGGESAKAYREYLQSQGYDIEGFRQPILVRRRTSEMSEADRVRFAQEANASASLSMSAGEQAATDASRLTPEMLALYRGGPLTSAENRDFAKAFLGRVADKGQEGTFATGTGALSLDGTRRMQTALLSAAYDDPRLVAALADEDDPNIRAFGRALMDLSGDVARLRAGIKAGSIEPTADLTPALTEAAGIVRRARADGVGIGDLVAQTDAFNPVSSKARKVLQIAYGEELSGRLSRERLNEIMQKAVATAEQQSSDARLFGEPMGAEAILDGVMARYGTASQAAGYARGIADRPSDYGVRSGEGRSDAVPSSPEGSRRDGSGSEGAGAGGSSTGGRGRGVDPSILERPPLEPNFDREAAGRLRAATTATRELKETFGTKTLSPILKRSSSTAPYDMQDAAVAARIFRPGSAGPEALASYRAAVGDEKALQVVEAYAVDRLRRSATRHDGALDPAKIDAWRRNHSDVLRSLPDLDRRIALAADDARFLGEAQAAGPAAIRDAETAGTRRIREAETMQRDRIARASKARDEKVRGEKVSVVGDILKVSDPDDVVRTVGSIFGRKDAVAQMTNLRRAVGNSAEGREGLRRAVAEHIASKFVSNTEAATSGNTLLKSDQLQTFVRHNKAALRAAGFEEADIGLLERIVTDLQRANRSNSAVQLPGRSNTAQDLPKSLLGRIKSALPASVAGGVGFTGGGLGGAVAASLAANAIADMRLAGLQRLDEILTDALLDPAKARLLLSTPSRRTEAQTFKALGQLYRRSAAASVLSSLDGDGTGTEEREPVRIDVRRAAGQ